MRLGQYLYREKHVISAQGNHFNEIISLFYFKTYMNCSCIFDRIILL